MEFAPGISVDEEKAVRPRAVQLGPEGAYLARVFGRRDVAENMGFRWKWKLRGIEVLEETRLRGLKVGGTLGSSFRFRTSSFSDRLLGSVALLTYERSPQLGS